MARIFIADDDPDIRHLFRFSLADEGHEVGVARNGEEALEAIVAEPPDLLIVDVMMPGMDGYELLDALEAAGIKDALKILVVTARNSEKDWELGFEKGADLYMTKPFDPSELAAAVHDLLNAGEAELRVRRERERDRAHLLSQLEDILGDV